MAEWHRFDYGDKANTAPMDDGPVWVIEEFYGDGAVELGYFDGCTFRLFGGSDDCSVAWWATIDYPEPPTEVVDHD